MTITVKPKYHHLPFTYEPKMAAVFSGECTQTIRKNKIPIDEPHSGYCRHCRRLLLEEDILIFSKSRVRCQCGRSGLVSEILPSRKHEGDILELHGWKGRPYASPWTNRTMVQCTEVIVVAMSEDGIQGATFAPWDHWYADYLATLDFIEGGTGLALKEVLAQKNKDWEGYYDIIHWGPWKTTDG